jgi:hypothetical protein
MESSKIEELKSNYIKDEARLIKEYDGKKPLNKVILENFLVKKEGLEDDILWCNGRCNGAADGPFCSSICIDIWSAKVIKARYYLMSI